MGVGELAELQHASHAIPAVARRVIEDDDAFAAWYGVEQPRLLAAMTAFTGDHHVAQDVVGEAFARALANWARVGEMDSPTGWTYRVACNVARRRGRRATMERRLLRQPDPSVWHDADHEAIEVWDAVRALPPRQRLAIALRYGAGCTEAEVATAMGIAVGTASATLVAARRSLAVALSEPSEDEDD